MPLRELYWREIVPLRSSQVDSIITFFITVSQTKLQTMLQAGIQDK